MSKAAERLTAAAYKAVDAFTDALTLSRYENPDKWQEDLQDALQAAGELLGERLPHLLVAQKKREDAALAWADWLVRGTVESLGDLARVLAVDGEVRFHILDRLTADPVLVESATALLVLVEGLARADNRETAELAQAADGRGLVAAVVDGIARDPSAAARVISAAALDSDEGAELARRALERPCCTGCGRKA